MKEAEIKANKESNPQFQQHLKEVKEVADKLEGKESIIQNITIQNSTKLAERTDYINQAQTINIYQSEHG